ncbi:hypothetical protein PENSPDRAFT_671328 [Peniophora sp. CONT]|nr:hypothetical protein PENSPDRAFT_671328 [Peniophora sp. CONT]
MSHSDDPGGSANWTSVQARTITSSGDGNNSFVSSALHAQFGGSGHQSGAGGSPGSSLAPHGSGLLSQVDAAAAQRRHERMLEEIRMVRAMGRTIGKNKNKKQRQFSLQEMQDRLESFTRMRDQPMGPPPMETSPGFALDLPPSGADPTNISTPGYVQSCLASLGRALKITYMLRKVVALRAQNRTIHRGTRLSRHKRTTKPFPASINDGITQSSSKTLRVPATDLHFSPTRDHHIRASGFVRVTDATVAAFAQPFHSMQTRSLERTYVIA